MTIPVNRLKLLAFMFGAATAGLTGSIFAAVQIGVFPQNFELALLITVYAMVILGGAGSIGGVVLGAVTIGITLEVLRDAEWGRVIFYLLLLTGILVLVREWRYMPWVVGAVVVLGVLSVQIVGELWPRSVGRAAVAPDGPLGGVVDNWVLLPEKPGTIGSVAFVVLVLGVLALTLAKGWVRIAGAVPLAYLGVFVWENKLIFQPSVTRFLLVGALLVFRHEPAASGPDGHGARGDRLMARLLELDGVGLSFGGLRVLDGLDLHVDEGEIVSVIGPNGAGKTTLFNVITGIYRPDEGDIRLGGESIVGLPRTRSRGRASRGPSSRCGCS